jgi:hypothetical protein
MFRVAVAALVFVGSFHPPVQSQWSQKAEPTVRFKTAEFVPALSALDRHEKLTAPPSEIRTPQARP